jgi:pimeloyl-ACP methyl ester carboxylesterase
MAKTAKSPADYILPLYINGLEGRMMRLPAKRGHKREILYLYGHHSSLERWWGLAEELSKFGNVTVPDIPGFGGMQSLYKIGQQATIDNLADYLAAFVKLRYRNKKVTIAAMSLGFVVATRMLQRYPDLTRKVNLLISIVGCAHKEDFTFSRRRTFLYRLAAMMLSRKLPAYCFQQIILRPSIIRRVYHRGHSSKEKFIGISGDEFDRTMDVEVVLWKINDVRTWMKTTLEMLSLNNCTKRVDLPVYHVAAKKDRYFNNTKVEEHMRRIFSDFQAFYTKVPNHAPTIIADAKTAAPFIPVELRKMLSKKVI